VCAGLGGFLYILALGRKNPSSFQPQIIRHAENQESMSQEGDKKVTLMDTGREGNLFYHFIKLFAFRNIFTMKCFQLEIINMVHSF
jgi:hypothetical protein